MAQVNREEDWHIMKARYDVQEAQKEVERKKDHYSALVRQQKQRVWESMKELTLVKGTKDAEG